MPPGAEQCAAIARTTGGRCAKRRVPGSKYCVVHIDRMSLVVSALVGALVSIVLAPIAQPLLDWLSPSVELQQLRKPEVLDAEIAQAREARDWTRLSDALESSQHIPEIYDNWSFSRGVLAMVRDYPADPARYFKAIRPSSPYFIRGQKKLAEHYRDRFGASNPSEARAQLAGIAAFIRESGLNSAFASYLDLASRPYPPSFEEAADSFRRLWVSHGDVYSFETDTLMPIRRVAIEGVSDAPSSELDNEEIADLVARNK